MAAYRAQQLAVGHGWAHAACDGQEADVEMTKQARVGTSVPQIPVYVIHWHAPDWIEGTVVSVRASTEITPLVTVINNGGSLPNGLDAQVVDMDRNMGYAAAANYGLGLFSRTDLPLCVVAAHDLRVQPDTLVKLATAAFAHPDFGLLGPSLREHGMAIGPSDRGVTERDWISGTCLLMRRSCIEDVGSFDERFGSYVEDVDFCERARSRGWRVGTVERAKATGLGSRDPGRAEMMTHANHALLDAKHHRWSLVARRLVGLARRCITDPRRRDFWFSTLLLALRRLTLLAKGSSPRTCSRQA
jgi:N-acetylglucosaminyl-diphospho-decaprenol L-rhamnosyltransferase